MASGWYQQGLLKIADGTIDLDTDTIKVMLVDDTYSYNPDHNDVGDISTNELSGVSGYTGGFAGAGRKTATVTMQVNDTSNRLDIAIADLTWTGLGTGDTIGGAVVIFENTNDAGSTPIAFLDLTDTPTNGSDVTLDFTALGSGGNLRIAA